MKQGQMQVKTKPLLRGWCVNVDPTHGNPG